MPIKIKLVEDRELEIDVDLDEWKVAFQRAIENDEVIQIHNSRGGVLGINPHQVLYWVADESSPHLEASRQVPAS